MATIEVIIRDPEGKVFDKENRLIYPMDLGKATFYEIEGAVEQFKKRVLPDIEAELLEEAQKKFIEGKAKTLICNGKVPVTLKTLHGEIDFKLQRFIDRSDGEDRQVNYFDMTRQFQERYVSDRLQEVVCYYSNRFSYTEVARLVERLTGTDQLSDQTIWKIETDKALAVNKQREAEVHEVMSKAPHDLPKVAEAVDIYDPKSREIRLFQDGIQVPGQKENRHRNQSVSKDNDDFSEDNKTSPVSSQVILLEKKSGGFEYMTEVIDEAGEEVVTLPEVIKSQVIKEYGEEKEPLPVVAIADGAKDIRQCLLTVFGVGLIIILDWYHLGKKVREFMSMICRNKEEKKEHLKFLFSHLWHGQVYAVLDYLQTKVIPKNPDKLQELINYIEKHKKEIINYKRRKKAGKPIGSGRVEKGCDQVIGFRQKKKGMSWSKLGSRSLGSLRVVELNGQWESLWLPKDAANDNGCLPLAANL